MISISFDATGITPVECLDSLVPLNKIWPGSTIAESIVVQTVITWNSNHRFGVLSTALIMGLIRDSLMGGGAKTLSVSHALETHG